MTDGDLLAQFLCLGLDLQTLPGAGGDGLLQQNVIACVQSSHDMAVVVPVLGGDDGGVSDGAQGQQLLAAAEAHILRHFQCVAQGFQPVGAELCDGNDGVAVLMCPVAVDGAAGTCADDDVGHGKILPFSFHHSTVPAGNQRWK